MYHKRRIATNDPWTCIKRENIELHNLEKFEPQRAAVPWHNLGSAPLSLDFTSEAAAARGLAAPLLDAGSSAAVPLAAPRLRAGCSSAAMPLGAPRLCAGCSNAALRPARRHPGSRWRGAPPPLLPSSPQHLHRRTGRRAPPDPRQPRGHERLRRLQLRHAAGPAGVLCWAGRRWDLWGGGEPGTGRSPAVGSAGAGAGCVRG